ncbi:hypothetical protein ACKI10_17960 [Streptomyces galilaeus]|uniref:Uncharacterized protein n=1 Tax=Streptomyces galilaeus TaxID=33899 RepID=A0ABW9IN61_STRGJ
MSTITVSHFSGRDLKTGWFIQFPYAVGGPLEFPNRGFYPIASVARTGNHLELVVRSEGGHTAYLFEDSLVRAVTDVQ